MLQCFMQSKYIKQFIEENEKQHAQQTFLYTLHDILK